MRRVLVFIIAALLFVLVVVVFRTARWSELPDEASLSWAHAPMVYSIGMMEGDSPLSVTNSVAPEDKPVLTASDVTDVKASSVADPFMVKSGDLWYMFFEVMNIGSGHGDIGMAESSDGRSWTYGGIVLDEPFHLSYPCVFEWNDKFYMVPEAYHSRAIRLYEADNFPGHWVFVTNLVEGCYVDPTVFKDDNGWWLLACSGANRNLFLFHSDELLEGWKEHPLSPVVRNNIRSARPGGRAVYYDHRFFRFAQDCVPTYGTSLNCFRIDSLSSDKYSEEKAADRMLGPGMFEWAKDGMHHADPHELENGRWMACVDGWVYVRPEVKLDLVFENGSMLVGETLSHVSARPGEKIKMVFFWKGIPERDKTESLAAFVHFNKDGKSIFEADYNIKSGCEVYEKIVEMPKDAPAGSYDVVCGLYNPALQERYRVKTSNPQHHRAVTLPVHFTVSL